MHVSGCEVRLIVVIPCSCYSAVMPPYALLFYLLQRVFIGLCRGVLCHLGAETLRARAFTRGIVPFPLIHHVTACKCLIQPSPCWLSDCPPVCLTLQFCIDTHMTLPTLLSCMTLASLSTSSSTDIHRVRLFAPGTYVFSSWRKLHGFHLTISSVDIGLPD